MVQVHNYNEVLRSLNQLGDLKRQLDELYKEFKALAKDKAAGGLLYSQYKEEEDLKPVLQKNIVETAEIKSDVKLLTGKKLELEKELQEKHLKLVKSQQEVRDLKKRLVVAKAAQLKPEKSEGGSTPRPSDIPSIEDRKRQIRLEQENGLLQFQSELAHLEELRTSFKRENAELDSMVKELTSKARMNDLKIKDLLRMQRTRQTQLQGMPGNKKSGVKKHLEEVVRQQDLEIERKLRKIFGEDQAVRGSATAKPQRDALFYETSSSPGARNTGRLKYLRGSASQSLMNPNSGAKPNREPVQAFRDPVQPSTAIERTNKHTDRMVDLPPPRPPAAHRLPALEDRDIPPHKPNPEQPAAGKHEERPAPTRTDLPKPAPLKPAPPPETSNQDQPKLASQTTGKQAATVKPEENLSTVQERSEPAAGSRERVLGVDGNTSNLSKPPVPPSPAITQPTPQDNKQIPPEAPSTLHTTKHKTDIEKLGRDLGLSANQIDGMDSTSKKFSLGGESSIPREPDITTKTITAVKQSDSGGPKDPSLDKVQKNLTKQSEMTKQDFPDPAGAKPLDLSSSNTYPRAALQDKPVPKTSNTLKPPHLHQNLLNSSQENEEEDWNVLEP